MSERYVENIGGGATFKLRVVSKTGRPNLYLEISRKTPTGWTISREGLGHADPNEARVYAYKLLASLLEERPELGVPAKMGRPTNADRAPETVGGPITLGRVVELYEKSASFRACTLETQNDRRTACAILTDFVDPGTGVAWRDLPAAQLDPEKVQALVTAWSTGAYAHPKMKRKTAKPGRIRNALTYLRTACNWAHTVRTASGRLLPEKVFDGIELPVEQNPLQPRMPDDVLDRLLAYASGPRRSHARRGRADSQLQFRLLLLCTEAWGNRINATLLLRPEDIGDDTVTWHFENDKMGKDRTSYLPPDLRDAIRAELERADRPTSPFIFFKPTAPALPLPYATAMDWLESAFEALDLTRPAGLGYHSLRRKWRSDRDDQPLKAVMEEGGWSSVEAAMRYAKPNTEERKAVALAGRKRKVVTQVVTQPGNKSDADG